MKSLSLQSRTKSLFNKQVSLFIISLIFYVLCTLVYKSGVYQCARWYWLQLYFFISICARELHNGVFVSWGQISRVQISPTSLSMSLTHLIFQAWVTTPLGRGHWNSDCTYLCHKKKKYYSFFIPRNDLVIEWFILYLRVLSSNSTNTIKLTTNSSIVICLF